MKPRRFSARVPADERRAIFSQWLSGLRGRLSRRPPSGPPDPERVRYYFMARSVTGGFDDFLDSATPWYVDWLGRSSLLSDLLRREAPLRILEYGCGQGGFLKWALEVRGTRPLRYQGYDLNDASIARCRTAFPAEVATFEGGDITRPETSDIGAFDLVVCINVFPYLRDLGPVLARIRETRVHRDSIVVVVDPVPSAYWDADYGTFRIELRTPGAIAGEMERAGFALKERGTLYGFPFLPLTACGIFKPGE